MELHSLSTGRKPRVVTAMTMLKQMLFRYARTTIVTLFIALTGYIGTKDTSVQPWYSVASMSPAHNFLQSIHTVPQTSSHM